MLLQACLNGARGLAEHPALPVTPAAMALDAAAVVAAGAVSVHLHPKDARGVDSLNGGVLAAALTAVREASPGVPIGVTTGAWAAPDPGERIAAIRGWTVLPDFASVNWHEDGADEVAAALLDRGVAVEAGLWHAGAVADWLSSRRRDQCLRVLLEIPDRLDDRATVRQADRLVAQVAGSARSSGPAVPVLLHGEGSSCWPALRHAHRMGLATRIGLEDTLELPDGSPSPDNATLVAAARQLLSLRRRHAIPRGPNLSAMTETELQTNADFIALEDDVAAHNYSPLPVVVAEAEGVWVTDVEGNRYIDALAGYSALNFGHRHPDLVAAAKAQLDRSTLTSRAFHNDQLGPFCRDLAHLVGKDMILPMNTGAEAVETALKVARKWGYQVKGVAADQARIIVMAGNFHGRTTTIVSFSDDPEAHDDYGPYTPGFDSVPFGDLAAVEAAITDETVAVLVEPIQGEQGVLIPKEGFLPGLRELCTTRNVLMIADEIQSGLGRTGTTLACGYEDVEADIYTLGKALGGGIVPVSAIAADAEVMNVITPGTHGSTFGGNPLAAAIGHAVVKMLATGEPQQRAAALEGTFRERLEALIGQGLVSVRVRGLWAGVDIDPELLTGKEVCKRMAKRGVLAKDTHGSTIRLAPPLVISEDELAQVVDALADVLSEARMTS